MEKYRDSSEGEFDAGTDSPEGANAELWWWVLLALALLAVAESWLGNRHMTAEHLTAEKENEKEMVA